MNNFFLVIVCFLLTACVTETPQPLISSDLLHDELFAAPTVSIRAEDAINMTDAMREFARAKLSSASGHVNNRDLRQTLIEALYTKGELRLEYASDITRTAGEAFDSKSGNCLSLVLLTAAMARELNIPYHYQSVVDATDWTQSDRFFLTIGHVNIVLESVPDLLELKSWNAQQLIVDFLSPDKALELDTRVIDENTIFAMFLNNRAVETLLQGKIDDAYWWSKAALEQDNQLLNAYLTLGILYRAVHRPELEERVLERVALRYPDNVSVLTNQIQALLDLGRDEEAAELKKRVAVLNQRRPWSYYFDAQIEFYAGRYENARHLYEKEIARNPGHHEMEYGLALIEIKLNDSASAVLHLQRAIELCHTRQVRELYQAELEKLTGAAAR